MPRAAAARRYARALFALAQEAGRTAEVRDEVGRLGKQLAENAELHGVLFQPLHPASERRAVLGAVCDAIGASPLLRNFQSFLIDQRRLVEWDEIAAEYGRLADAAAGVTKARVVSAAPLSAEQQARLARALERKSGGTIQLTVEIDPALVGGVVAQVGDLVYDGSLRTQLRRLRASLTRG